MRTITRRTVTMLVAGALGLGGLAAAAPALADGDPFGVPAPMGTAVPGFGYGMGSGFGNGVCRGTGLNAARGILTVVQKSALASLAQREKLAQDLYATFAARYDEAVFGHTAMAESHHLAAVRTLLERYGVADPTIGRPAGSFTDPAVQTTYDAFTKQGGVDLAAALAVGQQVERDAIAGLTAALDGLTAPDAQQVYTHLLAASQRHLTVFSR